MLLGVGCCGKGIRLDSNLGGWYGQEEADAISLLQWHCNNTHVPVDD